MIKHTPYNNTDVTMLSYIENVNKDENFLAINYNGKKIYKNDFIKNVNKVTQAFIRSGIKKGDIVSIVNDKTPECIYSIYALTELNARVFFFNEKDINLKDKLKNIPSKLVICPNYVYPIIKGHIDDKRIIITPTYNNIFNTLLKKYYLSSFKGIMWECFSKKGFNIEDTDYEIIDNEILNNEIISKTINDIVKQHYIMHKSNNFDFQISRGFKYLNVSDNFSISDIHLSLALGLELILVNDNNIKPLTPNIICADQQNWQSLVLNKKYIDMSKLRIAIIEGERISSIFENKINEFLKECGTLTNISECFRNNEIWGPLTYNFNPNNKKSTVGRPLPKYKVGIFKIDINNKEKDNTNNDDMISKAYYKVLDDGEYDTIYEGRIGCACVGEICFQIPNEVVIKNDKIKKHDDGELWYHSHLYGYIDVDKSLVILDEVKKIFIRNGEVILASYLEDIALNSNLVNYVTVIPRKSKNNIEENVPIMYIVLKKNTVEYQEQFIEYCNKFIKCNSSIYQYTFIDSIPENINEFYELICEYDKVYPKANEEPFTYKSHKVEMIPLKKMRK